jgi:hypothetical protein
MAYNPYTSSISVSERIVLYVSEAFEKYSFAIENKLEVS